MVGLYAQQKKRFDMTKIDLEKLEQRVKSLPSVQNEALIYITQRDVARKTATK